LHRMRDMIHMQPCPDTQLQLMFHALTPCA